MFVAAALLKDLLRSLPDCLLMCGHYAEWVQLAEAYADNKVVDPVKRWVNDCTGNIGMIESPLLFT